MSEDKKPKVLIVHNYYQIPGGEDTVVANEKKLLEDYGHEVVLYTRDNSELKTMGKCRKVLLPFTTIYNPQTARDIKKIIKDQGVDIIHVHNTLNLISPSVYYVARNCGVPIVQTIHNFRLLCPGATFYRDGHICEDCVNKGLRCAVKHGCYRGSKAQTLVCVISTLIHRWTGIYGKINYICLTEFNKKKLLQIKQIKPTHVFVKPNFVEKGEGSKRRSGFIFAGRLDEVKGIKVLIEAWKLMGVDAPHLTICGTGSLEEWCRDQIVHNKLNAEVMGFVSNAEVKSLTGKSKALVLPTMCYEGFPMSILEAYSVGTPVICSDVGNVASIVKDEESGVKFIPGNPSNLAEIIISFNLLGFGAENEYIRHYSPEINYAELVRIYNAVIENSSGFKA